MGKFLRTFWVIFASLSMWTDASAVLAKTSLDVSVGFSGAFRASRWTPVFVTAADDSPRNVEIEVYAPHDLIHGMRIRQTVAITPAPATFVIYVPMPADGMSIGVTLRDAASKRRLVYWDAEEAVQAGRWNSQSVQRLIGVAGAGRAAGVLERQLAGQGSYSLAVRTILPTQLPTSPVGLDALDALILDEPDLARMQPEQQSAIIAWVRGGGRLICWFGSDSIPGGSEIVANLPAGVDENIAISLSEEAVSRAGLPPRFRAMKVRRLIPAPGAEPVDFFSGELLAYRRSLGFGSITLLPGSPSTFTFNTQKDSLAFWQKIVGKLAPDLDENNRLRHTGYNPTQQNEAEAATLLMDQLGSVPGAGSFGFSYVVIVMIGMMLIVGPVDWIVLKKLNRQPWTWATTTGWIALVTLGAIYLGHVYKSGDLHFRTVQMIDQADNMSQAVIDTAGIYSPRTQDYVLKVDPEGWWEPLATSIYYRGSRTKLNALGFHQDRHGTTPEAMQVNVWNLEFLRGETIDLAPPVVKADLHIESRDEVDHLVGTITNLTDVPFDNVSLRFRSQGSKFARIGAAETANVDVALDQVAVSSSYAWQQERQAARGDGVQRPRQLLIEPIWGIASRRSDRIDEMLLGSNSLACIYASSEGVSPRVQLESPGAIPMHRRYIRALVSLSKGQP